MDDDWRLSLARPLNATGPYWSNTLWNVIRIHVPSLEKRGKLLFCSVGNVVLQLVEW